MRVPDDGKPYSSPPVVGHISLGNGNPGAVSVPLRRINDLENKVKELENDIRDLIKVVNKLVESMII